MFVLETLVGVILKKIYIILIYKYWHYNLCWCCFEEDKNYHFSDLFALLQNFLKDIISRNPMSVLISIFSKLQRLSTIPE